MGKKQVIDWKKPKNIEHGEALGDKQLNAKLKEGDGDLVYTPKLKAVLDAGKQTLKVTASATKNFEATEAEVTLMVEKAKPLIVWKDPKPLLYGDALSANELNAVLKEGDGALAYAKPAAIGIRPPGGSLTLRVDVAATKNFEAGSATVTLVVAPVVQLVDVDLPESFEYGASYKLSSAFKLRRFSGDPVIDPPLYLKDFSVLKPGKHKFSFKLAGNAGLLPYERDFEFEVKAPPPIEVDTWMTKLGFRGTGNLYIKDLGVFGGAGQMTVAKGKKLHLSIFKTQLPNEIPALTSAEDVRDILFPDAGDSGFHVTLEYHTSGPALNNPHVYRGVPGIYKGRGVTYSKAEFDALENKLGKVLKDELADLKTAIVASKWCKA